MVDREIFTYLKKVQEVQKVQDFRFLNGTAHHVIVNGAVWSNPLIFLPH